MRQRRAVEGIESSSFRDPSGFIFRRAGVLYRQLNKSYEEDYTTLMSSGLHQELCQRGLLIEHEPVAVEPFAPELASRVLKPVPVPFISYPYEWCFSQLKDAALLTLEIQRRAFEKGLVLKDASAFNVQFLEGKPIFIDTLSFARAEPDRPWAAYRQFCQHFLAPLALMALRDIRLSQLLTRFIDGVPLDLASSLLPRRSYLRAGLLMHVHLHARSQKRHESEGRKAGVRARGFSKMAMLGLIDSLRSAVTGLSWQPEGTTWAGYYGATNYSDTAFGHKERLVREFIAEAQPGSVWDLGANEGVFSRIAAAAQRDTVSFDIDPAAVERNYRRCKADKESRILPLLLDLTNPTPAIGWAGQERAALVERGPAALLLALALIHHLAIGNNLPLAHIARFLAELGAELIIEFVPKSDSLVQRMLASREDIFHDYHEEAFVEAFEKCFTVQRRAPIEGSDRVLFLMTRK